MKYRREDQRNWRSWTIFINQKEWQSNRQMRKTDKSRLCHHTHSSALCCVSPLAITILQLQDGGEQRVSLETVALHCFSLLLGSSIFRKTKTLNSNQKFTMDFLFLLQALLPGSFFLAYGNILMLICSWILCHSLTEALKRELT